VYGAKITFKVANRNSVADAIQQTNQQMQMILAQRAQPRAEPVIPDCLRGVDPDVVRPDHLTPGSPECMTAKEKATLNNGPVTQMIVGQANAARENAAADRQSEARQEEDRTRSECVSKHERGGKDNRCANGAVR
jgi:hypothetical protein